MLFAEVNGLPDGSSTPATFAGRDVRSKCELTRNSTSESTSQNAISPTSASRIRFGLLQRRHFVPVPVPPP